MRYAKFAAPLIVGLIGIVGTLVGVTMAQRVTAKPPDSQTTTRPPPKSTGAWARIVQPEQGQENLMWAVIQCSQGHEPSCVLSANTIAGLESAGQEAKLCAVWGPDSRAHCLEIETGMDASSRGGGQ